MKQTGLVEYIIKLLLITVTSGGAIVAAQSKITPINYPILQEPEKVMLGKALFKDPLLLGNDGLTCLSCHFLNQGGSYPAALGHPAQGVGINVPTVLNTSLNFRWKWNGRFTSLKDHLLSAIDNNSQHDSWSDILHRLRSQGDYQARFEGVYGELTQATVVDAIVRYEEALIAPSPFDAYLQGQEDAISEKAKLGYQRFQEYGCIACHQGKNIGGNLLQPIGLINPFFTSDKVIQSIDLGRFNVTGRAEDKHIFRVPSLRNVARTGPYLHDGSIEDLGNAVRIIAYHQLGRYLPSDDVDLIVAFLTTLSGDPLAELLP